MTLCEIYKKIGSFPFTVDCVSRFQSIDHPQVIITGIDNSPKGPHKASGKYYLATTMLGEAIESRWSGWGQYEIPLSSTLGNIPQVNITQVNVCTCGGAKVNSTHSHWCDFLQKVG